MFTQDVEDFVEEEERPQQRPAPAKQPDAVADAIKKLNAAKSLDELRVTFTALPRAIQTLVEGEKNLRKADLAKLAELAAMAADGPPLHPNDDGTGDPFGGDQKKPAKGTVSGVNAIAR